MPDPDLLELAGIVGQRCVVRGDFVLKSGATSGTYFDKYAFVSDPVLLRRIVDRMAALVPAGTELLGGLELGGIPLATLLSARTGIPAVLVRKRAKTYGLMRIVEGQEVFGRKVLLVDDLITSGGATRDAAIALRAEGATVDAVICAVDRTTSPATALSEVGITVLAVLTDALLTGPDQRDVDGVHGGSTEAAG